jgi:putative addiction module component (TIGR02574 family)
MPTTLEKVAHDAIELSRHDRLALARILLDLDAPSAGEDVDAAWDAEIRARLAAYDEGRVQAEPFEEVRARMQRRFAR